MEPKSIIQSFLIKNDLAFKSNHPLANVTFTKTGGICDFYITPSNKTELKIVVDFLRENNVPYMIIGNASNLIIADTNLKGCIINLENMNKITVLKDNNIVAQAGALLVNVSKEAAENSLTGLEFACGIPGSIGGAVYMNAGAYGGEIKDVLTEVLVISHEGEFLTLSNQDLAFNYRTSILKNEKYIVIEAVFSLEKGVKQEILDKVHHLTELRESKQPLELPSCGSVFKRPEGHYVGALIQEAGLQGYRIGGVEISKKHAGFMVNVDNGTATDYIELIEFVKKEIRKRFNVELETEVKIVNSI